MTLTIMRENSAHGATHGVLFVDGCFECFTLEDEVRDAKIPGVTAIPAGTYSVALTHSPRFGRVLPLVQRVPGFEGVRIHAGNTAGDTHGCVLVGRTRGTATIGESALALSRLMTKLEQPKGPIALVIASVSSVRQKE